MNWYYKDEKEDKEKYQRYSGEDEKEEEESSSSSASICRQLDCKDLTEKELTDKKIQEIIDFLKHMYGESLEEAINEEKLIEKIKEFKGNGATIISYIYQIT